MRWTLSAVFTSDATQHHRKAAKHRQNEDATSHNFIADGIRRRTDRHRHGSPLHAHLQNHF
jgi:hypothetical protein